MFWIIYFKIAYSFWVCLCVYNCTSIHHSIINLYCLTANELDFKRMDNSKSMYMFHYCLEWTAFSSTLLVYNINFVVTSFCTSNILLHHEDKIKRFKIEIKRKYENSKNFDMLKKKMLWTCISLARHFCFVTFSLLTYAFLQIDQNQL